MLSEVPAGDSQMFSFTPSGFGTAFQLADTTTTPYDSGYLFPGGTYSVAETVPPFWALTSATCSDGSPVTAIALRTSETVTRTVTNTKQAKIIVDIVTDPTPSSANFEFDPSWSTTNFFLIDAATLKESGWFAPGTYSVCEINIPAGWSLISAVCGDGSPVTTIMLSPGETVTCTFTN